MLLNNNDMGFKVIKKESQQKQFCDYVQNKIDIAKEHNTTYELSDEDKRIQTLYDDNTLKTRENIKILSRVKSMEDGKEYLVISKDVVFEDKLTGIRRDSYSVQEGVTELPLEVTNEDGVTEATQVKLDYDIPFTKAKVLEAMRKAGSRSATLTFYDGPETGNRKLSNVPMVGNLDFFINASWEELLLGKELKVVSSRVNRLDEVRKDTNENTTINTQQSLIEEEEEEVSPDNLTNKLEEEEEVNKEITIPVETKKIIAPSTSPTTGGGSGTVKLKVSNNAPPSPNHKKD